MTAVTASASSAPPSAIRMPPHSTPARNPTLSTALQTALEAASWRGASASDGSSAACAGLCPVPIAVNSAASTSTTTAGPSDHTSSAATASTSARSSASTSSTLRREWRSPSSDVAGAASAAGAIRATAATPTSDAPPTPYAYTDSATKNAQPPSEHATQAACSRRRDRVPSASRRAQPATARQWVSPAKSRPYGTGPGADKRRDPKAV